MSASMDAGEIYDRYAPRIYRYIYHRLGQRALAEDLTGDVFVHFVRARVSPDHVLAYLYRTAHNVVVDYLRRSPGWPEAIGDEVVADRDDPARLAEIQAERMRLRRAIARLTADQQQVIVLKYLEGLPNAEIARVLGRPEGACKALAHRGLANLRNLLGAETPRTAQLEFAELLR